METEYIEKQAAIDELDRYGRDILDLLRLIREV